MPLIYITGLSGSGKSTVCRELKRLGYDAYDIDKAPDKDGIKLSRGFVEQLSRESKDKQIFLCGVKPRPQEAKVQDLFDKIIYLRADESTLRDRLSSRKTNDYGKSEDDLNKILGWARGADSYHKQAGTTTIDSSQPLEDVVDEVIREAV